MSVSSGKANELGADQHWLTLGQLLINALANYHCQTTHCAFVTPCRLHVGDKLVTCGHNGIHKAQTSHVNISQSGNKNISFFTWHIFLLVRHFANLTRYHEHYLLSFFKTVFSDIFSFCTVAYSLLGISYYSVCVIEWVSVTIDTTNSADFNNYWIIHKIVVILIQSAKASNYQPASKLSRAVHHMRELACSCRLSNYKTDYSITYPSLRYIIFFSHQQYPNNNHNPTTLK